MASSKLKLLTCLIILSLFVGCVPVFATPTPIPPLDPNAIGTFMVQTADAASTQTMVALPPPTLTATLTLTPRSTFTPIPSFTVQPYLFPSPTNSQTLQFYRVKHDHQLAMYDFKSRTFDENSEDVRKQTPEVVPLFMQPKVTSGTSRTDVSGAWERYMNDLNDNNSSKLAYLKGKTAGLFNTAGFPQMESLTMGGNIVTLNAVQGDWGEVNSMAYGSPPVAAEVNYITRPDLVQKFVVVGWKKSTKSTTLAKPPKGDLYWPLVSGHSLWIQMDRLEPFPILPMEVTANVDIYLQTQPGPKMEETRFRLLKGTKATVVMYYPSGADVWGKLGNGNWVPLLYHRQFYTTWTMATPPPP